MTNAIIITLCVLVLIAYVFDLTSSKTKIPSVILLLVLGWILRQLAMYLQVKIPDLSPVLPVLGTMGLILIVLEGSLELELDKSKSVVILKSFLIGLLPMLFLSFGLAYVFHSSGHGDFRTNLLNAIPLGVISSAIAIPSVRGLSAYSREFIIYESSLSDIFGVLLFNFVEQNRGYGPHAFAHFSLEILIIVVVSFAATIGLALLLSKVTHPIKFVPIILLIVLIYAISKVYHLPSLIFILFFGLFISNIKEMKSMEWIEKLKPEVLSKEVHKFRDLTVEGAFLIRSVFFLLFGYLIDTAELLNPKTFLWAFAITAAIFVLRAIHLRIFRLPLSPLVFVAPRGLITILLFLSIELHDAIPLVNKSLVIQIIVLTALVMMIGLIRNKETSEDKRIPKDQLE